jgi:hypothetical protein
MTNQQPPITNQQPPWVVQGYSDITGWCVAVRLALYRSAVVPALEEMRSRVTAFVGPILDTVYQRCNDVLRPLRKPGR